MIGAISLPTIIHIFAALTMIVMAGLYFSFSNTIMTALRRHEAGANVMVLINEVILNPLFMLCFWGSAMYALFLALFGTGAHIFAGAIYFLGTTVVTLFKSIPLNNRLRDAPSDEARAKVWDLYLDRWVKWNHLRALCALCTCAMLMI